MINARAETITSKPAFRAAASTRRCLVPADGYYEWERRPGLGHTTPTYLSASNPPLMFAGLYEFWRASTDSEWLTTFTIVTSPAPDALGHIHDRAPIILQRELHKAWLDPELTAAEEVRGLLASARSPALTAWEVSSGVGTHRNNGPQLTQPITR